VARFARGSRGDGQCHASGKAVAQHRSVHEFPPAENSTFERNCWIEINIRAVRPNRAAKRRSSGIKRRLEEAIRVICRVADSALALTYARWKCDNKIRPRSLVSRTEGNSMWRYYRDTISRPNSKSSFSGNLRESLPVISLMPDHVGEAISEKSEASVRVRGR